MKAATLLLPLLLLPVVAHAQALVPPEVVRFENMRVEGDQRIVYVGNAQHHYFLFCAIDAAGCITPESGKNYLLFDAKTRWKMPGAKDFITLTFVQDWTGKYKEGENIGLVPEQGGDPDELGMLLIDRTGGGYYADTIVSDGPIIYGTGMNLEDRSNAWKNFFLLMVDAVIKQKGNDALGVSLARRCNSGEDFCAITISANLVGIGGIKEPRTVILIVTTALNDKNKQLSRTVCTRPTKDKTVCRDFDTGKLVTDFVP